MRDELNQQDIVYGFAVFPYSACRREPEAQERGTESSEMLTRRAFLVWLATLVVLSTNLIGQQAPGGTTAQSAAPQAQAHTLTGAEAKEHIGETATVCGVVASTRYAVSSRGQPTFLNLDKPYPNQPLTVVIWGVARSNFPEAPEVAYRNKRICVTGRIDTYRGVPQIVVGTPGAFQMSRP